MHGLADIVTNQPEASHPLFVKEQVQDVDATYLFSIFSCRVNTTRAGRNVDGQLSGLSHGLR